ncbi:enhancer of split m7 protein-like [Stylophora pistillata]|uniref:enhancer of split m7 protein-like n=1 Tax=Stylophora pistillata TaxID=50429 RepID=UPI000C047FB0|nr:enhancer of split m7 protein-like [Stylophora pistillata]
MKFPVSRATDKKVNKSIQDRLRRERISKSVEALRELVLGPSTEHTKIGKADILKLTVQYIRRLKERMENVGEDQETVEICNRESSARISSSGNNFGKPSVCSTKEQTKQTEERNILEKDVSSDNSKFYDSGYVSNQIFSSKSQSCSTRSTLFGNTTNDCGKDAVKRKPFRQLNYNNNRGTDRQTIWRPW